MCKGTPRRTRKRGETLISRNTYQWRRPPISLHNKLPLVYPPFPITSPDPLPHPQLRLPSWAGHANLGGGLGHFRELCSFLWSLPRIRRIQVIKLQFGFLLLICFVLFIFFIPRGSQPQTRKGRGKMLFPLLLSRASLHYAPCATCLKRFFYTPDVALGAVDNASGHLLCRRGAGPTRHRSGPGFWGLTAGRMA